jgi:hypothetical protein
MTLRARVRRGRFAGDQVNARLSLLTMTERPTDDNHLDEAIEETFPASDAPANTVEVGVRVRGVDEWPALPYESWKDTYATLHMWTQIVGKIALARGPRMNHSWGIALKPTARGLRTAMLPDGDRMFDIEFDLLEHRLVVTTSDGEGRSLDLRPMSVAAFYRELLDLLSGLSIAVSIWTMPVEIANPIRFTEDEVHRSYDRESVGRFRRIIALVAPVLENARCPFIGKCSPVHFFWGAFDLAVTRFSGRRAPDRSGPAFMREAYSHEVISHGFWPGGDPLPEPCFYAYAVPEPAGLKELRISPDAAYYHAELGEFILPYDAVRIAPSPSRAITDFIDSTYSAAATLGRWDRAALER